MPAFFWENNDGPDVMPTYLNESQYIIFTFHSLVKVHE